MRNIACECGQSGNDLYQSADEWAYLAFDATRDRGKLLVLTQKKMIDQFRECLAEGLIGGGGLRGLGGSFCQEESAIDERFASVIAERFPSIQTLRFCNSGTEANILAIVTAIAFRGVRGGSRGGIS